MECASVSTTQGGIDALVCVSVACMIDIALHRIDDLYCVCDYSRIPLSTITNINCMLFVSPHLAGSWHFFCTKSVDPYMCCVFISQQQSEVATFKPGQQMLWPLPLSGGHLGLQFTAALPMTTVTMKCTSLETMKAMDTLVSEFTMMGSPTCT